MEQERLFWQLLDYHFYKCEDLPDDVPDDVFEAHVRAKFPLIAHLDVYYSWKGLSIELCNHAVTPEQIKLTEFLIGQVFGFHDGVEEANARLKDYWRAHRPEAPKQDQSGPECAA